MSRPTSMQLANATYSFNDKFKTIDIFISGSDSDQLDKSLCASWSEPTADSISNVSSRGYGSSLSDPVGFAIRPKYVDYFCVHDDL